MTWPGQAVGYKIGQMKILELRKRTEHELGEKFDIKEFHEVLNRTFDIGGFKKVKHLFLGGAESCWPLGPA